jgi:hypothetical protein
VQVTSTNQDLDPLISPGEENPNFLSPEETNYNKPIQDAKSIFVREVDSLSFHDITIELSSFSPIVDSYFHSLRESTVYGGYVDPVLQAFGDECKRIEGFSSLIKMLNSIPSVGLLRGGVNQ